MLFYFESGKTVEKQPWSKVVSLSEDGKRPLSLVISNAEYIEISKDKSYYRSLQNSVRQPIIVEGK